MLILENKLEYNCITMLKYLEIIVKMTDTLKNNHRVKQIIWNLVLIFIKTTVEPLITGLGFYCPRYFLVVTFSNIYARSRV